MNIHYNEDRAPCVYLAGKITSGRNWRSDLVEDNKNKHDSSRPFSVTSRTQALDPDTVVSATVAAAGHDIDIVGPFFVACDHGCAHLTRTHATGPACEGVNLAEEDEIRSQVHEVNTARIRKADFVFACIDEVDCFCTIAETGFAHGAGVPVHLFFGENLTLAQRYDLWFVAKFADHVHERVTIQHAFARALKIESALAANLAGEG